MPCPRKLRCQNAKRGGNDDQSGTRQNNHRHTKQKDGNTDHTHNEFAETSGEITQSNCRPDPGKPFHTGTSSRSRRTSMISTGGSASPRTMTSPAPQAHNLATRSEIEFHLSAH